MIVLGWWDDTMVKDIIEYMRLGLYSQHWKKQKLDFIAKW